LKKFSRVVEKSQDTSSQLTCCTEKLDFTRKCHDVRLWRGHS